MSKTGFVIGLSFMLTLTGWLMVRPGPQTAHAAEATQEIQDDGVFSEDAAIHRYATSQTRHWRHLLIQKK